MTLNVTSSLVRVAAGADSSTEYVNPNALRRSTSLAAGVPLVEDTLFIAPEGQQYFRSVKITNNSIAEATASPRELDALNRALPTSLASITWPRTLLAPSEEGQVFGSQAVAALPSVVDADANAFAASQYVKVGNVTITIESEFTALA